MQPKIRVKQLAEAAFLVGAGITLEYGFSLPSALNDGRKFFLWVGVPLFTIGLFFDVWFAVRKWMKKRNRKSLSTKADPINSQ
jgi:hypothetical protein